MFLLNLLELILRLLYFKNLQYKMFLLNCLSNSNAKFKSSFTIQNVPIKYILVFLNPQVQMYLQYKMFLLNLVIKKMQESHLRNLQYKMFLLNSHSMREITESELNLQYKMFLLNKRTHIKPSMITKFTIQNVPIKLYLLLVFVAIVLIYNTKCSY